jgi:hypothetical protein
MPIIRDAMRDSRSPHVYEIYFSLNGSKIISYIGKTTGENSAYVSGSSELNRAIANTVLCFGEALAAKGWHKVILAEFPSGTPNGALEAEEKRLILESYEECRQLGPGKNWEILNKEHLRKIWQTSAKSVLKRLRAHKADRDLNENFRHSDQPVIEFQKEEPLDSLSSKLEPVNSSSLSRNAIDTSTYFLETNFFQRISSKLGSKVPVSINLMAYPGLKRSSIKMRILFSVLLEMQRAEGCFSGLHSIRTSTLKYILKEPNLSPAKVREMLEELSLAIQTDGVLRLSEVSESSRSFKFRIDCGPGILWADTMAVSIDYEKFMVVASDGKQSALGRRFFTIQAGWQYFQRTGSGLPFELAMSLITGKRVPAVGEVEKRRELQSSCCKAIKSSEGWLCQALGTTFATNYFTKKKLREIKEEFPSVESDFRVLIDNAETPFANFMAILAE